MARVLIAGLLAAAVVTPLLAQPVAPPAPPAPLLSPRAPMATMTRADIAARVQAQFARRDANRDGVLTSDELSRRGERRGAGGQRRMVVMRHGGANAPHAMANPNAAFDRLDANRDGSISRDEFGRARQVRIERRVMRAPGQPGQPGQPPAVRVMRLNGGGMMGAAMLRQADANRDGRVTLAEATGAALRHFDMMDRNRDGRVTPDERAAGRAHMRQMRQAG